MSIAAMKQAIDCLQCAYNLQQIDDLIPPHAPVKQTLDALHKAIEQAEKQEPVVWMYQDKSTHEVRFQKHMRGFVDHGATYETPLYTTPQPQREWVGLTEEERDDIWNRYCDEMGEASINDAPDIFQAIEQALKEKNT